ncbi:pilin [Chromobacterium vaccinii]|nr:pilin [Chromobacterium vaccinii]
MAEYYATNNAFISGTGPNNASYGLATSITGTSVQGLAVGASGIIYVAFNSTVASGGAIALVPVVGSGGMSWNCYYSNATAAGTAPTGYTMNGLTANVVPTTCRN